MNFLKKQTDVQDSKDSLGGGFVLDTGLYDVIVESAYMDQSTGGAHNINFVFKTPEGKTLNETIYITSGTAKGTLNYYVDRTGAKQYLPGFTTANDISLATAGVDLSELEPENKMIEVYNRDLGKKVPTEKPMLMDIIGKPFKIGVQKVREYKNVKTDKGYEPSDQTREYNEIAKVFGESGHTVVEATAGAEAKFIDKWQEKNPNNFVKDKTKGVTPVVTGGGTAPTTSAAPTTSLFNK